jgi:hypothetical protein
MTWDTSFEVVYDGTTTPGDLRPRASLGLDQERNMVLNGITWKYMGAMTLVKKHGGHI